MLRPLGQFALPTSTDRVTSEHMTTARVRTQLSPLSGLELRRRHRLEKYQDVFFMDHIWAAKETWRGRLLAIEMLVFQEVLIVRGLKEHLDEEDQMLTCVSYPLGYLVVLATECLEEVNKVNDEVIHNDLLV